MSDGEITQRALNVVLKDFNRLISSFKYDYLQSKIGSLNIGFEPEPMPRMWDAFRYGWILDYEEMAIDILSIGCKINNTTQYSDMDILLARCQNFFVGFMRELDLCYKIKRLDPAGHIYKDIESDLGEGRIDILYKRSCDGISIPIAVAHEGISSDFHEKRRKDYKSDHNLVVLRASNNYNNKGIHLIDAKSVEKICKP